MTAATAILLRLWLDIRQPQKTDTVSSYLQSYVDNGFENAFESAVSILTTSQATAIVEELENELTVHSLHAQSLADYIRYMHSHWQTTSGKLSRYEHR